MDEKRYLPGQSPKVWVQFTHIITTIFTDLANLHAIIDSKNGIHAYWKGRKKDHEKYIELLKSGLRGGSDAGIHVWSRLFRDDVSTVGTM